MTTVSLVLIALFGVPAQALPPFKASANPLSDALRTSLASASKNLTGSAELMPADKYSFHPTPAQMTFGQLIVHIVQTNMALCSGISGTPAPLTPADMQKMSATDSKDALVASIKRSFDYCTEALGKADDSRLAEEVTMFGRQAGLSRAAVMLILAADWADHYSTAASYLRLNDILPPSAQPKR
jgi:uncharacterized damage-inducible protein DinB